ncbi:MAG TPA: hypothetical protein ENN55_04860, partial [Firmicutes bacterium]|nr:hypothetical protein [Bacillota bacterium]
MKVAVDKSAGIFSADCECFVFFVYEDENIFAGKKGLFLKPAELFKAGKISGEYKKNRSFTFGSGKKNIRVITAGLGRKKELDAEKIRQAAGILVKEARAAGVEKTAVFNIFADEKYVEAMADGMFLASYEYGMFHTTKKKTISNIVFFNVDAARGRLLKERAVICANVNRARDLQNMPANTATPSYIEKEAKGAASRIKKLAVKAFGLEDIKKMKMGAFYAVARGAKEPAKLVVMNYKGGAAGKKPLVFIGKGITFDTGGISLKPQSTPVGG